MRLGFDAQRAYRKLPVLAGAFVAASGAMAALTVSTQSQSFPLLMHGLVGVGILASLFGIAIERRFTGIGIGLMVMGCAMILVNHDLGPWTDTFFPLDLQALEEAQIAVVFAWMLAGFCFMQGTENSGAFVAATGMAIFGLMATVNLNAELIASFWVYIFGIVFMWGYERLLDLAESGTVTDERSPRWEVWARWHLSSTALLTLLMMAVAFGVGTIAYNASPNLYERVSGQVREIAARLPASSIYADQQGDFRVGTGPINLPPIPIFSVKTSSPTLWRVGAYDLYDGRGWRQMIHRQIGLIRAGELKYRVPGREPPAPYEPVDTFYFSSGVPRDVPAATAPVQITLYWSEEWPENSPADPGVSTVYADAYGGIHVDEDPYSAYSEIDTTDMLADRYSVVSRRPPTDAETLRGRGQTYHEYIQEHYVDQVPLQAQRRLGGLVSETVQGIEDPYDRVVALREMIERRCLYTLEAPAIPRGEDAAAHFLLQSRRGACDLFATALVVTSRMAGVPARVVTGYQVGEYDSEFGLITVRESDAHAWTEVFFPHVGWVPFDMQATEEYAGRSWLDLFRVGHARLGLGMLLGRIVQVLVVVLVLYMAASALFDPARFVGGLLHREKPSSRLEAVSRDYRKLYRVIARRADLEPRDWMTPREVVEASIENITAPAGLIQRLERLNEQFYELRYDRQPTPEKINVVRDGIQQMNRQMKKFRRKS